MRKENVTTQEAKTKDGQIISISDLGEGQNGKKGYFCLGCGHEMVAVFNPEDKKSYFRHHATDVKVEHKCTYGNETYRHSVAKQILMRIKEIVVPTAYTYHPTDLKKPKMFIEKSKKIQAATVLAERYFFEDKDGNIVFDKKDSSKDIQVKPDIAFLNELNEPILFIEICATHKVDKEKLIKYGYIGVDTIEIKVPPSGKEEIEANFYKTRNSLWLFHYNSENTKYVEPSNSPRETVSSDTDQSRRNFKNSYRCIATEISNLKRGIEAFVSSKQFREFAAENTRLLHKAEKNAANEEREIDRIERDIREYKTEQKHLRERVQERLFSGIRGEIKAVERLTEDTQRETQSAEWSIRIRRNSQERLLEPIRKSKQAELGKSEEKARADFERIEAEARAKYEKTEEESTGRIQEITTKLVRDRVRKSTVGCRREVEESIRDEFSNRGRISRERNELAKREIEEETRRIEKLIIDKKLEKGK